MKKQHLAFVAASFFLLTGFHGGCGTRDPAKRAERAQRMARSHVEDLLEDVDADATQTQRILGHTDAMTKQALVLHAEHQTTKALLHDQWKSPKPDAALIHRTIDERTEGVRKFLHALADAVIDTHQTLTPEQRQEVYDELH
ncbi:MAG: hypothetical protein RIT81_18590 [Deltaproteobacteria bacterium]